jgi:predicted nucleic acid-binding protein/post-segregation antitoxin (ccd killing protein)
MARVNIFLPDELADRVKVADVNVSAIAQVALEKELRRASLHDWLERVGDLPALADGDSPARWRPCDSRQEFARRGMGAGVVIDSASVVEVLIRGDRELSVVEAIVGRSLAAPAHIDAEVVALLAGFHAAGASDERVRERIELYLDMPLTRHPLPALVRGAWSHRGSLPDLSDGLYVELAEWLGVPLVTCDPVMAAAYPRSILAERIT